MEFVEAGNLFNKYGKLLTNNQQEILNDYLNLDIGLSEIAQNRNATRQAIKSIIDKALLKLKDIEEKLSGSI